MSIFIKAYLAKARKHEVKAEQGKNGVVLSLDIYDGLAIEQTPEQWKLCIEKLAEVDPSILPDSGGF